jgi:hypothetical protein
MLQIVKFRNINDCNPKFAILDASDISQAARVVPEGATLADCHPQATAVVRPLAAAKAHRQDLVWVQGW